jgi:ethylbenzene dioxygenase beta subunit
MCVENCGVENSVAAEPLPLRDAKPPRRGQSASPEVVHEVQQFYYFEARLLDEERYEEWLGLMTPDIRYWMPGIQARYRKDKAPKLSAKRMAFFDDDFLNLRRRVTRFMHDTAWAEDPPTRAVHTISNVEVELTGKDGELRAWSAFVVVRGRNEREESWLAGRRSDLLRRGGDGLLRITERQVTITETVLLAKNLNVFL